jgi:hypothetical protein
MVKHGMAGLSVIYWPNYPSMDAVSIMFFHPFCCDFATTLQFPPEICRTGDVFIPNWGHGIALLVRLFGNPTTLLLFVVQTDNLSTVDRSFLT